MEHVAAYDTEHGVHAEKLLGLLASGALSQVVAVAAELGIADLLAGGPLTVDELAGATACHAQSLHRLMRALASADCCTEREDGSFALTATGSLLRSNENDGVSSYAVWWGRYRWPVWGRLLHSVRTGESARKLVTGTVGFDHLNCDREAAVIFNRAMAEITRTIAEGVLCAYDFSRMRRIVDVGGGYGELLAAILAAHPRMRGVLFDLRHAIEGAAERLERAGVLERCELVVGDFLEFVPPDADCYILKTIIHDWDDEHAARILGNCRKAASQNTPLLLLERVMPERVQPSSHDQRVAVADLNMLVMLGGRERTIAEYRTTLESAGYRLAGITQVGFDFCLIEASASNHFQ